MENPGHTTGEYNVQLQTQKQCGKGIEDSNRDQICRHAHE